VQTHFNLIESITTMEGQQWRAKIFADCSYEGDLMAQAGVKYVIGRESIEQYGEDLAGVRTNTPAHQFLCPSLPTTTITTCCPRSIPALWPRQDLETSWSRHIIFV
jgi:FAD dependent oxidoreductase